jgi:predicted DNA-binding transcriptional regulator AlpA
VQQPNRIRSIKDVGGVTEVAQALGIDRRTVWKYEKIHYDFPRPVHRVAATPLWYIPDVIEWMERYKRVRKKGGAPKGNHNATGSNGYQIKPRRTS